MPATMTITADSVLVKSQKQTLWSPVYKDEDGRNHQVKVEIRYDDSCGNGHNTFSITGDVYLCADLSEARVRWESGGCIHEEITKAMPELSPLVKWHLVSSDGPMHYLAGTIFAAGERDCHGLLKGEFRQFTDKTTGALRWEIDIPRDYQLWGNKWTVTGDKPAPVTFEYKPYGRTGEGKSRDLDGARRIAVWLDATDEDLTAPGLRERLEARLPGLLAEFRKDVEGLGFVW
jgi:hypothetical protein